MRRWLFFVVFVTMSALPATPAGAHGQREVGAVSWSVGWAAEPAYVGIPNAVQLRIGDGSADVRVSVEISIGDQTSEPISMQATSSGEGEYRSDLLPTVPGDYAFRFRGSVGGRGVDETFRASKDGFSLVEGTSDIAFPKKAPTNTELAERLVFVERTASDAEDAVALPRALAIVGIVLGLIAIVLAARPRKAQR